MPLLEGLRVLQIGPGRAAAVCGRILADMGAAVGCLDGDGAQPFDTWLMAGKQPVAALGEAAMIVVEGSPETLRHRGWEEASLRRQAPDAVVVLISPYGQTGPLAERPASDLTLFCASGISTLLTGQVDDLSEPPIRPVGHQSAFIGGLAAACAGMHALLSGARNRTIDVSVQEALATLAMTELARAGLGRSGWQRKRLTDGNGATVCILPASDGYAAISPRETHQWTAWLEVMGSPAWGAEARFATKKDRVAHWDELYALMCDWSRRHTKHWIADAAQAARVPGYLLQELRQHIVSEQLAHRGFFQPMDMGGRIVSAPGTAFRISGDGSTAAPLPANADTLPLKGIRVLDFSWVIAGPTTTRYLAAMGADVIKVEAPGSGDPGRTSELHTVLGQGKRAITLDLKTEEGRDIARRLASECDVLVENFGTGVMERFGLGADELRAANPGLVYLSASGMGRTGPDAKRVAYGTLLQCYSGFAGLNAHPGTPPRVGFAWLDPMCGLKLAFGVAAALWRRRQTGQGCRIDFSMIEAMLWTMAEPLLATQLGDVPVPRGNDSDDHAPHGVYRAAGEDAWVGIAVADDAQWQSLCVLAPGLAALRNARFGERRQKRAEIDAALNEWTGSRSADDVAALLAEAGIATAPVETSRDLATSEHLAARGFWENTAAGTLPGLPWKASFSRATGPAPELGADNDAVMRDVLHLSDAEVATLRAAGAFG
jgi:crotonobetainyl-CoA:carnitine CoA-transferase CaiB-like acyl-CoA transferase